MKGVSAAIVTHFASDLTVDHAAVQAEVERLIDEGIGGGPCRPPRLELQPAELDELRAAVSRAAPVRV